nr:histone H3, embryonic [Ipomoea batatas]GMC97760.1 histone H3, embryonic [Ipomoea batatas]
MGARSLDDWKSFITCLSSMGARSLDDWKSFITCPIDRDREYLNDLACPIDNDREYLNDLAHATYSRRRIQFFISSDCQLQMPRGDTLHLKILTRISSQLQHFSSQILQDSGRVNSRCSSHPAICCGSLFQQSMDTPHWELHFANVSQKGNSHVMYPR